MAELSGSTVVRQMVRVWSRLLAVVVQHWLTVATVWGDATKSLNKVHEAVREFTGRLAAALDCQTVMHCVLEEMTVVFAKTCRRNKRSKAGHGSGQGNILGGERSCISVKLGTMANHQFAHLLATLRQLASFARSMERKSVTYIEAFLNHARYHPQASSGASGRLGPMRLGAGRLGAP